MPLLLPGGHALAACVPVRVDQGHQARCVRPLPALFNLRSKAGVDQVHEDLRQASSVEEPVCHCDECIDCHKSQRLHSELFCAAWKPVQNAFYSVTLGYNMYQQVVMLGTFFLFRTPRSTG